MVGGGWRVLGEWGCWVCAGLRLAMLWLFACCYCLRDAFDIRRPFSVLNGLICRFRQRNAGFEHPQAAEV